MLVSVEVSMYPLSASYSEHIDKFILLFRNHKDIEVKVNGMSTQLFGSIHVIWPLLQEGIQQTHSHLQASFIIKVISGIHQPDQIPDYLK
jgi:uncharacterized protein YqgV (UPF0045/DUF77 family)